MLSRCAITFSLIFVQIYYINYLLPALFKHQFLLEIILFQCIYFKKGNLFFDLTIIIYILILHSLIINSIYFCSYKSYTNINIFAVNEAKILISLPIYYQFYYLFHNVIYVYTYMVRRFEHA